MVVRCQFCYLKFSTSIVSRYPLIYHHVTLASERHCRGKWEIEDWFKTWPLIPSPSNDYSTTFQQLFLSSFHSSFVRSHSCNSFVALNQFHFLSHTVAVGNAVRDDVHMMSANCPPPPAWHCHTYATSNVLFLADRTLPISADIPCG